MQLIYILLLFFTLLSVLFVYCALIISSRLSREEERHKE